MSVKQLNLTCCDSKKYSYNHKNNNNKKTETQTKQFR